MPSLRQRVRYPFDVAKAVEAVRAFNSSSTLMAADRLLHEHFADPTSALDPSTVAKQVVLLDGIWGTQLFRQAGAANCIADQLVKYSAQLINRLQGLPVDCLLQAPETVIEIAAWALPVILRPLPDGPTQYKENYSFATKFLHWLTRHHFPIVDKRARRLVYELQLTQRIKTRVYSDPASVTPKNRLEDYHRWIQFYTDLIVGLTKHDREMLLRVDTETQPRGYAVPNTLLRILDKVFYIQGDGGLGRISKQAAGA